MTLSPSVGQFILLRIGRCTLLKVISDGYYILQERFDNNFLLIFSQKMNSKNFS